MFEIGRFYSRQEIHDRVGGSVQSYLPHVRGVVVAACTGLDKNPDAPTVILPGLGQGIERAAELFCSQCHAVPTFIKRHVGEWEYVGPFSVSNYSVDRDVVREHAQKANRSDVSRVIFLKPA